MLIEGLIAIACLLLVWIFSENYFPPKNVPPGPLRLPILGSAFHLILNRWKQPVFVTFRNLAQRYGPVVYLRMGDRRTVILDDFEMSKQMLNSDFWVNRPIREFVYETPVDDPGGIIFSSGEGWKEMRRFSMRTLRDFGYGRQPSMQQTVEEQATSLLAKVEEVASKEGVLSVKYLFTMPVLNILWGMVSSVRTAEDDVKLKTLLKLVDANVSSSPIGGMILDLFPGLRHIAPEMTGAKLIWKNIANIKGYFRELMEARRKEGSYKEDGRDFIDIFIQEIDKHKALGSVPNHYTDYQFQRTLKDLFEAGSETSSNSLEFAVFFTMRNPEVQRKIQEEIDKVVGRNRLPTMEDRVKMPYTEATLLEVQRMANVLPVTARSATEDTTLGGFHVPKGTMGIVNIYSIHMKPSFWTDPFTFRPDRFLDSNNSIIPSRAARVIPFGAGKRVCLGEQMARATLFSYFTALLQSYSFESVKDPELDKIPEDSKDPEGTFFRKYVRVGFTLSPTPFRAKLIKRN